MSDTHYQDHITNISQHLITLRSGITDTMKGFSAMSRAAMAPGVLDEKTKELIAMAIGVATRCDGCLGFHGKALVRLGASEDEVREMLAVAIYMGGGPSLMYAAHAWEAFTEFAAVENK